MCGPGYEPRETKELSKTSEGEILLRSQILVWGVAAWMGETTPETIGAEGMNWGVSVLYFKVTIQWPSVWINTSCASFCASLPSELRADAQGMRT